MRMRDVDHTHPHTDEPFGELHSRGTVVAADGGRDDLSRRVSPDGDEADAAETRDTMEDVHHEPPTEGANRAFERGTEGRTDTV